MKNRTSIYVIVVISIAVGLLHFVTGPDYHGPFRHFVQGYLIDLVLPMNVYLLLQISLRKQLPVRSSRLLGAMATMLIGISAELLQLAGFRIFGNTFDPLDILMYGLGIGLGLMIDMTLIDKLEDRARVEE